MSYHKALAYVKQKLNKNFSNQVQTECYILFFTNTSQFPFIVFSSLMDYPIGSGMFSSSQPHQGPWTLYTVADIKLFFTETPPLVVLILLREE